MVPSFLQHTAASIPAMSVRADWVGACFQSFCLVGSAELFDKTWFVALLMALKHPKGTVFTSCYLALVVHTIIAAIFGYGISKTMPIRTLHFSAAALYTVFACMYFRDWHHADPHSDIIAAGKEEAGEAIADYTEEQIYGSMEKGGSRKMGTSKWTQVFSQCFTAMFIAEWGDRTQIAMVGQHASQPLIPVCLGSLMAFFLLTFTAVLAGMLLAGRSLSEKTVHLFSAISFLVFAALAVRDGLTMQPVDLR
jgi:putative Ca2+/H+ antiporter (TMEM165/GDT1 family)